MACLQSDPWEVDVGTTPGVHILETSREGFLAATVGVFSTHVCESVKERESTRGAQTVGHQS